MKAIITCTDGWRIKVEAPPNTPKPALQLKCKQLINEGAIKGATVKIK